MSIRDLEEKMFKRAKECNKSYDMLVDEIMDWAENQEKSIDKEMIDKVIEMADFGDMIFVENSNIHYEDVGYDCAVVSCYFEDEMGEKTIYQLKVDRKNGRLYVECDALLNQSEIIEYLNK